jgi:uncharacterized protein
MSPRLKRLRKVLNPPAVKGFKPYGPDLQQKESEKVLLLFEEYEALRLCDYDMFNHHKASQIMDVSRPTFTRIYASARQKIARAFVEGKSIAIEGGKVYFDSDWYHCTNCLCYFNIPDKINGKNECPLCGSMQISGFDYENSINESEIRRCEDKCRCPNCGFEKQHEYGKPCSEEICPKCNIHMKRKGTPGC